MKAPKADNKNDQAVIDRFFAEGEGQVFRFWDELSPESRKKLLRQAATVDFGLLKRLVEEHVKSAEAAAKIGDVQPAPAISVPQTDEEKKKEDEARKLGEELIAGGKVAAFVVSGGQATRLGYDYPKGMYPVTPVKGKSLFQLHAEKILARGRRHNVAIPWYIMTSEANHRQTVDFFEEQKFFGLNPGDVRFFQQAMIPAVDKSGKLMLEAKDRIFTNPNGHGGSLMALKDSGSLDDMRKRGVEEIFYFQVDNPLLRICDPVFIGYHVRAKAQMSTKVVRKDDPMEKVGVIGLIDGKLGMIEYSDLTPEQMRERLPDGRLKYDGGNIAVHMLNVDFVEKMNKGGLQLPYHKAVKKAAHIDDKGKLVEPEKPNAVKFETFVFDALGFCESSVTMEVVRGEEFHPLKNAEGDDSPETVRRAQIEMYSRWLQYAGIILPRTTAKDGRPWAVEIGPLTALDREELAARVRAGYSFSWELYI
ncbi:MAG: UTP--glucose-1-phosphate uridylyltransferase [Planctomycetota bacterium]